jgi:hypothetical protein
VGCLRRSTLELRLSLITHVSITRQTVVSEPNREETGLTHALLLGKEAIRATVASGVRSVLCYCAHPRVTSWKPELTFEKEWFPDWVMATFRELASMQPFGPNGQVRLGFALDVALVPPRVLKDVFDEVRALGAHLITSHETRSRMLDRKHLDFSKLSCPHSFLLATLGG